MQFRIARAMHHKSTTTLSIELFLLLDCGLLIILSLPSSVSSSDISFFRIICRFLDDNDFFCQKYLCFICRKLSRFSRLGRITLSIPSPQQLRVIVVSLGREEMETSGCSLAISIKDDIGEYSVKWEGKWGAENWGFWYIANFCFPFSELLLITSHWWKKPFNFWKQLGESNFYFFLEFLSTLHNLQFDHYMW